MKQKLHFQHVVAAAAEIWDLYSISDLKIDFTLCKPNPSLQSHRVMKILNLKEGIK